MTRAAVVAGALAFALYGCARDAELARRPPALSAEVPIDAPVAGAPWRPDPDAGPAADPLPPAPRLEVDPGVRAPRSRALGRNELVSGRLPAAGRLARYAVDADAGEVALFELWTWGLARGATTRARLEVLGEDGGALAAQEATCGETGRLFVPFVAPHAGRYELVLSAAIDAFRFHLVRHSNYGVPDGAVAIDGRGRQRGWLGGDVDEARVSLALDAGASALVRVTSTRLRDRADERPLDPEAPGGRAADARPLTPTFGLVEPGSSRPVGLVWLRAGAARRVELAVRAAVAAGGGFFDVVVEREPETARVTGLVLDRDDEPLPGVALEFALEPERTVLAEARTDADGRYTVELLTGPYRVRYGRGRAYDEARTQVDADREVNLIWFP